MVDPIECWPEIDRLPNISLAKMVYLEISQKLKFGVCNHGKPCANPHTAKEGECF